MKTVFYCRCCGFRMRNGSQDGDVCLPCVLENTTFEPNIRDAFSTRGLYMIPFRPRLLVNFYRPVFVHRPLIKNVLERNTLIIKVCEQLERERELFVGRGFDPKISLSTGCEYTVDGMSGGYYRLLTHRLLTTCLEVQNGMCAYCNKIIELSSKPHLDSILPTNFDHSVGRQGRYMYYKMMFDDNLLAVACGNCHLRKSVSERCALSHLRYIQNYKYQLLPLSSEMRPDVCRPQKTYLTKLSGGNKKGFKKLVADEKNFLRTILGIHAYRVALGCTCLSNELGLFYEPTSRTFSFACEKHYRWEHGLFVASLKKRMKHHSLRLDRIRKLKFLDRTTDYGKITNRTI